MILKWVLTDLMMCKPQHTLHAVSQLDANGRVTKHVKNASIIIIVALEQIPDRLATRPPVRDGRAMPSYTCCATDSKSVQCLPEVLLFFTLFSSSSLPLTCRYAICTG